MQTVSNSRKGMIVGGTLFLGVALGGVYAGTPSTHVTSEALTTCGPPVFAGRAGMIPDYCPTSEDRVARQIVGTTGTGAAVGFFSGGPIGAGWGALGGLLSNIPW